MTPIDLIVKEHLRKFLEKEFNHAANQQQSLVPALVLRKVDMEPFLDRMWVAINKSQMEHDSEHSDLTV